MINGILCLLYPLLSGCGAYIVHLPSSSDVILSAGALMRNRQYYASRELVVTGTVRHLNQFQTQTGFAAERFLLCDGSCVRVFMGEQSDVLNGQHVAVRGKFSRVYRTGNQIFHDEIEATGIFPRP